MTIEERANHLYCDADGYVKDSANDYMRLGYIRGAAQQKAIDYKEYRKDMQYVNVKRQEWLDKACKWLKENAQFYQEDDFIHTDKLVEDFKKELEG